MGSAWQVEIWEPAALIPVYTNCQDVVGLARVADRLETESKRTPSLRFYAPLARRAELLAGGGGGDEYASLSAKLADQRPARSFIGWAATYGFIARDWNAAGNHAAAKAICERALAQVTDADREFVALFLGLDLELAVAEAALGDVDAALARLGCLLEMHRENEHPLALGLVYESRARIAWAAGRRDEYAESLGQMEHWLRRTETPGLIAKCERVAELSGTPAASRRGLGTPASASVATQRRAGSASAARSGGDAMTVRAVPTKAESD